MYLHYAFTSYYFIYIYINIFFDSSLIFYSSVLSLPYRSFPLSFDNQLFTLYIFIYLFLYILFLGYFIVVYFLWITITFLLIYLYIYLFIRDISIFRY